MVTCLSAREHVGVARRRGPDAADAACWVPGDPVYVLLLWMLMLLPTTMNPMRRLLTQTSHLLVLRRAELQHAGRRTSCAHATCEPPSTIAREMQ